MTARFRFYDFPTFVDADLELHIRDRLPADPVKGYVPAYRFEMRVAVSGIAAGELELRLGDTEIIRKYGGHIGYRVYVPHRGRRYAARACRLIVPVARRHGYEQLWITCNPDNYPSRRTCELLGCELVEIVNVPSHLDMYRRGERKKCRYLWDLSQYP